MLEYKKKNKFTRFIASMQQNKTLSNFSSGVPSAFSRNLKY